MPWITKCAVRRIIESAQSNQPLGVSALAVHGVMTGVLDREHRHRLNQLELVVPDGQPVRWGPEPPASNQADRPGLWTRPDAKDLSRGGRGIAGSDLFVWQHPGKRWMSWNPG